MNESAPMFHFGWTEEGENWVAGHCFVLKCLSTFRDFLADVSRVNQGSVSWGQPIFPVHLNAIGQFAETTTLFVL